MKSVRVTGGNRAEVVAEASGVLLRGGVVILPTDTVYGLACHPDFPEALLRIYRIKSRDAGKPVAFLADSPEAPVRHGARLSAAARAFAARFWPGALTIVADCGGAAEGFRVPDRALTREIIAACGGLLRVTSANPSGEPAAVTADDASVRAIAALCDLVIDDGPADSGVASTVVRDGDGGWRILREGGVSAAMLAAAADAQGLRPAPELKAPAGRFVL